MLLQGFLHHSKLVWHHIVSVLMFDESIIQEVWGYLDDFNIVFVTGQNVFACGKFWVDSFLSQNGLCQKYLEFMSIDGLSVIHRAGSGWLGLLEALLIHPI